MLHRSGASLYDYLMHSLDSSIDRWHMSPVMRIMIVASAREMVNADDVSRMEVMLSSALAFGRTELMTRFATMTCGQMGPW